MKRSFTKKELYETLKSNPFEYEVEMFTTDFKNEQNIITANYVGGDFVARADDKGLIARRVEIRYSTKDANNRGKLDDWIVDNFNVSLSYNFSGTSGYYVDIYNTSLFMRSE